MRRPNALFQTVERAGALTPVQFRTAIGGPACQPVVLAGRLSNTLARLCAARGGPALVIGSTGFDAAELAEAAKTVAILRSSSFSVGLNMLVGLVEEASRALDPNDWDAEFFGGHHPGPRRQDRVAGQRAKRPRCYDRSAERTKGPAFIGRPRARGFLHAPARAFRVIRRVFDHPCRTSLAED